MSHERERRLRRVLGRLTVMAVPVVAALAATYWAQRALEERAEAADEPYESVVRLRAQGPAAQLAKALARAGSPPAQTESIVRAVSKRLGAAKADYDIEISTGGAFRWVRAQRPRRRFVIGPGTPGVKAAAILEETHRVAGRVRSSLPLSLAAAGMPPDLVPEFLDAFRWSADLFADVREGDRFAAVWTDRVAEGRTIGRRLEAVSYVGGAAGRHAAIYWDGELFDRERRSLRRQYLRAPLKHKAITSAYGLFRGRRRERQHRGIDYLAPIGTPVVAVADGTVEFVGWKGGYGNLVQLRHTLGRETVYGHLSRFWPGLRKGKAVRMGRVLGYVGETGNATGPHLHFEFRDNGEKGDFRSAALPSEPLRTAARPCRFQRRWRELLGER